MASPIKGAAQGIAIGLVALVLVLPVLAFVKGIDHRNDSKPAACAGFTDASGVRHCLGSHTSTTTKG